MFLESLYIILKTNTINDKSANFPPIYHNILKHEWKLSVTWLPWVCHLMDRFSSYGFVNSPLKFITIFDRYLTHTFTIFTALLYLVMFFTFLCNFCSISFPYLCTVISRRFILHFTFSVAYCHPFPITWWSVLRFCLYTSYCSLFLLINLFRSIFLPHFCCMIACFVFQTLSAFTKFCFMHLRCISSCSSNVIISATQP